MIATAHTEDIAAAENLPSSHASETTESTLVGAQTTSQAGKDKAAGKGADKDESDSKKSTPLVGRINNLITSDFNQIKTVQEFLDLREFPASEISIIISLKTLYHKASSIIQMGIGITFLYGILGWRCG